MSAQKLRIFVSSAFEELKNERVIAREIIAKKFKFTPMMFEDWGANTDASRVTYRQKVVNSDILVLILWREYSAPTEDEFLLADELRKDILVYIKKDEHRNREPKLTKLIDKIKDPQKGYIYYEFDTVLDLSERLQDNISKVISRRAKSSHKMVRLDFETLFSICERQVRAELQYLKGSSEERDKKYIPDLYVKRVEIEAEFEEFLKQQDKNSCVVVGEAGIGKTNLLCHLSEKLSRNRPVLFLNSLYLSEPLEENVHSIFQNENASKATFQELMNEINEILDEDDLDLVIFLDAINESPNPDKFKRDLAIFAHKNKGNRVKLYISCRDIDWEFFLRKNDMFLDCLYSKKGRVFLKKGFRFDEFTEGEYREAWRLYKRMYSLKGPLAKQLKKICKHPLMLRFLAEGFEGQHVPKDLRRIEIFDQYWFRKLEHTGRQDRATEYMFAIVKRLKKKKTSDLLKKEVVELLGDTTETLQTVLTKILSENLITYLNWAGNRVVGFAYEAFLEYVMARWIICGKPHRWLDKTNDALILELKDLIEEAKSYRTMKGTIQYLVMMMEGEKNDIHIDMLEELSETKDPTWQSFVISVAYKLRNAERITHVIERLAEQGSLRRFAIRALGDVGAKSAVGCLAKTLEDSDDEVRNESIMSLLKIGDRKALTVLTNTLASSTNLLAKHEIVKALSKSEEPSLASILSDMLAKADVFTKRYLIETLGALRDERCIEFLLDTIKQGHEVTLTSAIEALGRIVSNPTIPKEARDGAVCFLIDLLKHKDDFVKTSVARALGVIRSEEAIEPLLQLFTDEAVTVRNSAMEALCMIGGVDIEDCLIKILGHRNLYIRRRAIVSLGLVGSPTAIMALVEALPRETTLGRRGIFDALKAIGVEQALPVLLNALRKKHQRACFVIEAIGSLESNSAIEPLLDFLHKNPGQCDKEIVEAIGRIEGDKNTEILLDLMEKGNNSLKSYTIDVLGRMKETKALGRLRAFLKGSDEGLCKQSVIALGRIGHSSSINFLVKTLKRAQENPEMRLEIALALGLIGGEDVITPLVVLLKDENKLVRPVAADSLGLTRSGRAVTSLLDSLRTEEDEKAKLSMIRALGRIENVRAIIPLKKILQTEVKGYDAGSKTNADIIREIAVALGNIGSTRATKTLIEILETYKPMPLESRWESWKRCYEYRLEILEALVKIGDKAATDALMLFLRNSTEVYSGKSSYQHNRYEGKLRRVAREGLMKLFGNEIRA